MTARELFQAQKDLAGWWNSVSHADQFQKVLLYVRSELMSNELTPDAQRGARIFEETLTTLGEADGNSFLLPPVGLEHDLESDLRPHPTEVQPKQPERKARKKGK